MEKCGNLFCAGGEGFQRRTSAGATKIVRANGSIRLTACSACAGDYEDPDGTAGEEFEELLAGDEAEDADVDGQDNDSE